MTPGWLETALRLWKHTEVVIGDHGDECWSYTGSLNRGYGQVAYRGRTTRINRLSYALFWGAPDPGEDVHHRHGCPRSCWRPTHLRAVGHGAEHTSLHHAPPSDAVVEARRVHRREWEREWYARHRDELRARKNETARRLERAARRVKSGTGTTTMGGGGTVAVERG